MFGSRNFLFAKSGAPVFAGGKLFTWGLGNFGAQGQGDTTSRSSPTQVGALTNWAQISIVNSVVATKTDGTLWSWGTDLSSVGILGLGNTTTYLSPKQIGSLTDWSTPSLGNGQAACIKTDGTLWTWGDNSSGQLGLGNTTNYSSPKQVGSLTNWSVIGFGAAFSCGIDTSGKLFSWGRNNSGQLGLGNTTYYSSPKQVGTDTNWSKLASTGRNSMLCVKTDGTLWAWGANNYGQLGLGNTVNRSSPTQVGALTTWATAAQSNYGAFCVKTDGTLWSWGGGYDGGLGTGSTVNRSSPVQIGSLTDWAFPVGGTALGICIKTDKTIWSWGNNNSGRLGLGDTTNRSSPVQIGSLTSWIYKPTSSHPHVWSVGAAIQS